MQIPSNVRLSDFETQACRKKMVYYCQSGPINKRGEQNEQPTAVSKSDKDTVLKSCLLLKGGDETHS